MWRTSLHSTPPHLLAHVDPAGDDGTGGDGGGGDGSGRGDAEGSGDGDGSAQWAKALHTSRQSDGALLQFSSGAERQYAYGVHVGPHSAGTSLHGRGCGDADGSGDGDGSAQ